MRKSQSVGFVRRKHRLLAPRLISESFTTFAIAYSILGVVFATVYVLIARKNRGRWRYLLGAKALLWAIGTGTFFITAFLPWLQYGIHVLVLLLSVVMLGFLVYEKLSGKHRDWLHGLAIATLLFEVVSSAFWRVASYAGWFA